FISGKSEIDGANNTRGDFANDSAFRGLRFDMRNDMVRNVSGQLAGAPVSLADIGITINNDGTLELSDEEKLFNAIRNDSSGFEKLFNGADGYATRLTTRVGQFLGVNGLIDKREEVLDDKISRLDDRIADWDTRLERRENQLRAEYARLQEVIASLQSQSAAFYSYLNF
ncbi:MAG TPA: flagellar filament capping protein FliD, partial [Rhodothermales bacterium]